MDDEKHESKSKIEEEKDTENLEEKPTIEIDLAEEKPNKDFIKIRKPNNEEE